MKFLAIHGACCIAFSNLKNVSWLCDAFTICSESMNPIVPSFGYAGLTTGPPASLTRSSVPRFVIPIHADSSASALTTSLFWEASLRTFGLNCFSQLFASAIWLVDIEYGFLAPVAFPAIAFMSVGMFSSEIFPLYFGSRIACHESGTVFTYLGL